MNQERTRFHARHQLPRSAFTLIEVMIVIAIVLALMGIVGVAVFGQRDKAKQDLAAVDLGSIKAAIRLFNLDFGRNPTDEEGLEVLWNKDKLSPEADATKWRKYLESELSKDKWDKPFGYRQKSEHGDEATFDLWSNGPDGEEGTADDIVSWKKDAQDPGTTGPTSAGEAPPSAIQPPR
jgi:general secretion pathway protein G